MKHGLNTDNGIQVFDTTSLLFYSPIRFESVFHPWLKIVFCGFRIGSFGFLPGVAFRPPGVIILENFLGSLLQLTRANNYN